MTTTTNTSRPASGTATVGSPDWHTTNHTDALDRSFQPITSYNACDWDVCVEYRDWQTGDRRTCVVCAQPIVSTGSACGFRHIDLAADHGHEAHPRLAHPMDSDPFAGLPDTDEVEQPADQLAAEPEISLGKFQQRVADGHYQPASPPRPNHQQSTYGLSILAALGLRDRHVYAGTVNHATKTNRRARNRVARRSRRINRGH
ncbi:hypothetical protein [Actinophytocola sediminis]